MTQDKQNDRVAFRDPEVPHDPHLQQTFVQEDITIKSFPPLLGFWSYDPEKVGSHKKLLRSLLFITYTSSFVLLYNVVFSFSDLMFKISTRKSLATCAVLSFIYLFAFTPMIYRLVFIQGYKNILYIVNPVNAMNDDENRVGIGYMLFNISFGFWILFCIFLTVGPMDFSGAGIFSFAKLLSNNSPKDSGTKFYTSCAIFLFFILFMIMYILFQLVIYVKFIKLIYGRSIHPNTSKITNTEHITKPLVREVGKPQEF